MGQVEAQITITYNSDSAIPVVEIKGDILKYRLGNIPRYLKKAVRLHSRISNKGMEIERAERHARMKAALETETKDSAAINVVDVEPEPEQPVSFTLEDEPKFGEKPEQTFAIEANEQGDEANEQGDEGRTVGDAEGPGDSEGTAERD